MIGRLHGKLIEKLPPLVLLDVQGIGYEISVPLSILFQLPELGESLTLFTHLSIREDAHQLFGFLEKRERDLFRQLIKVNGVGPKLGLSLLSSLPVNALVVAVHEKDIAALTRIPGVGKKMAERLLVELPSYLKSWEIVPGEESAAGAAHSSDAIAALVSLGYKPREAEKAVEAIKKNDLSQEDLIKAALQELAVL